MLNYMVRKIKIVDVYTKPEANEEANHEEPAPTSGEATNEQANDTEPTIEPMIEASESEHEPPPPPEPKSEEIEEPAKKPKNKILDMPTTPKILQQVECQACKRKMSAKVLRYSHAKYCTEREKEPQPEAIPIPKLTIKNGEHLKEQTSLPVKSLKLKRATKSYTAPAEKEATPETPQPQRLPPQTPEMDQSFQYKMKQRLQQKEAKYQSMMSNAF